MLVIDALVKVLLGWVGCVLLFVICRLLLLQTVDVMFGLFVLLRFTVWVLLFDYFWCLLWLVC